MNRLVALAISLVAVLLLGGIIGMYVVLRENSKKNARDATERATAVTALGCDRNQLQRAYLQVRAEQDDQDDPDPVTQYAKDYFRIVDCGATYAQIDDPKPKTVYLMTEDEECFVNLVKQGYFRNVDPITSSTRLRTICASTP